MIADDLAGACDSGVQFARYGFKTVVRRGGKQPADTAADSPRSGDDKLFATPTLIPSTEASAPLPGT